MHDLILLTVKHQNGDLEAAAAFDIETNLVEVLKAWTSAGFHRWCKEKFANDRPRRTEETPKEETTQAGGQETPGDLGSGG